MTRLNTLELKHIRGGFGGWLFIGIVAVATLISGIITGIAHPYKCGR